MTASTMNVAEAAGARPSRVGWLRILRDRRVAFGSAVFLAFMVVAIIGPNVIHQSPLKVSYDTLQPPSSEHWLGTTHTGQDVFAQMVYGTRTTMLVGVAAAVIATFLSLVIGLASGFLGGTWDDGLSLVSNVTLVIPALPLVVIVAAYMPDSGSVGIILLIAFTAWAWGARVLRAQTLTLRRRDFIEAARATGESTWRIIFSEILPNMWALVASLFLSTLIGAILTMAGLAFLGLSDVTEYSWGGILYWAQNSAAMLYGAWWWFVPPGLAIAAVGTALALINFGIDGLIDPRLRGAGAGARQGVPRTKGRRGVAPRSKRAAGTGDFQVGDVALEIDGLSVEYAVGTAPVRAVDNVSLTLRRGEVLGIAGESGSGKSTLAYAIARLHRPPAQITAGRLTYRGRDGLTVDILQLTPEELRAFRWEELSITFQSAMNALNPILTIGAQVDDVLVAHRPKMDAAARSARVLELLRLVGISSDRVEAYPHELSGGMRQRAMIAIALALDPEIIVMDEPTTALDVVIQRQIIEQVIELKDRLGFSIVFITHDLSLLIELSDHIAIMYAGRVVEVARAADFYRRPLHPYSQGLLGSFPTLTGPRKTLVGIPGSPPDLRALPVGCSFAARCPLVIDACLSVSPPLLPTASSAGEQTRMAACLRVAHDPVPVVGTASRALLPASPAPVA